MPISKRNAHPLNKSLAFIMRKGKDFNKKNPWQIEKPILLHLASSGQAQQTADETLMSYGVLCATSRERKKKPSYSREISRCDAARQPGAKRASTRLFAKTIQLEYLKKKACTIRHFNLDGFLDHLDPAPHVPKPRDVPRQSLGSNRSFLRHTWLGNPTSLVIFAELPEALRLFLWCVGEGNGPSAPM